MGSESLRIRKKQQQHFKMNLNVALSLHIPQLITPNRDKAQQIYGLQIFNKKNQGQFSITYCRRYNVFQEDFVKIKT